MHRTTLALATTALLLSACATRDTQPSAAELDAQANATVRAAFRDQGIATTARLDQDKIQIECAKPQAPSAQVAEALMEAARATIKPPPDGRYWGDWKEGEKLAQNGRGMTWTDKSAEPASNGGNCYNCHQISPKEISFGTIGPSLAAYGKQRKVTGPDTPQGKAASEYVWAKLYNSHADSVCSLMPRFGAQGLLNAQQMQHLVALLLDPASPVNQ